MPVIGYVNGIGSLSGKIDCLLVSNDCIEIVDFKTDRNPPKKEVEVRENYLTQLAAYASLIKKAFPERCVHTYFLWTKNNILMPINNDFLNAYLPNLTENEPK